jgi:hypothetical protein
MDFNSTIDLIIKDLDEAREIIDDLKKYPGVPALQVELAKSKCKSAGEVIALLKDLKDDRPVVKEEPIKTKQASQLSEEKKIPVRPVKVSQLQEEIKDEKYPAEIAAPPVIKNDEKEKIHGKPTESTIVADNFSHLSNRFNEQLGILKSDNDITDMLNAKPLSTLSEAIGVNDKFLFIREIFNEDKDAYVQAISRLEHTESITDARAVIMSYTGDNNDNEAVKQLLDLVKRKLTSNE